MTSRSSQTALHITRIRVDDLFGEYTYDLANPNPANANESKILIIYGDNGSGKTTILKLLFHLLSPSGAAGHRGILAKMRFQRLLVTLGGSIKVVAERPSGVLEGGFEMSITKDGSVVARAKVVIGPDDKAKVRDTGEFGQTILGTLEELNLGLHFLSDDRKVAADLPSLARLPRDKEMETVDSRLRWAIGRSVEWIRQQAIQASGTGETNVNAIYTDIVRQIASPYGPDITEIRSDIGSLIDEIKAQSKRSLAFARFGLISELQVDELLEALGRVSIAAHPIVEQILRPYFNGIKVRLDALQRIEKTVRTFVEIINAFYWNKGLTFDLRDGIRIKSRSGDVLSPLLLSSGEKQLLLIFCNVLSAGDKSSIFVIDEPELSLNVKWQRKLVNALLDCTEQSNTQFILATHSLELLTQHDHSVLQLTDIREDRPVDQTT